jgi:threonine/homoserine/homoserine lactone efflux protein
MTWTTFAAFLIAKAEFRRRLERATGTVLIGLGVRMALSKL